MKKYPHMEKLRGLMYVAGMSHGELADALDRSGTYVSMRMTGKMPWDMDDVYKICDIFSIKPEEISVYFPRRERGA